MLTEVALGLQISEDRAHTSVVAAGFLEGDVIGVELLSYVDGSTAGTDEVVRLRAERKVLAVVVDARSPAATLIKPLTDAGVAVTQPTTADVVLANGLLLDALTAGTLRVAPHPALDAAARYGTQRPVSGAKAWERRGAPVDIGPLDAATMALWALTNHTPTVPLVDWR